MSDTTNILGKSKALEAVLKVIQKVAKTKTNVLIIGESGTGKELFARLIHESGPMASKPFIPVNCGAIPENLIESEMFGHKKGSFTGAVSDKMGLFEAANGGTLFLDEVGELPLPMQVKLLRAIQDRTIRRVGGVEDAKIDVRIIAATNRDLEAAVAKGAFREDLYYRLNVILIKTPPLRDREGDVEILIDYFLDRFLKKQGKPGKSFDPETLRLLKAYSWPGNIRELENTVERAVTLAAGDAIGKDVLPVAVQKGRAEPLSGTSAGLEIDFSKGAIQLEQVLFDLETLYLESALKFAKSDALKAAKLLSLSPAQFQDRIKKRRLKT